MENADVTSGSSTDVESFSEATRLYMDSTNVYSINEAFRPSVDSSDIQSFIRSKLNCKVVSVQELCSYENRNFCVKVEQNRNINNIFEESKKLLVKVINYTAECACKWQALKSVTRHLRDNGFVCSHILQDGEEMLTLQKNGNQFLVLLFYYIPGTPLSEKWSKLDKDKVIADAGEMVANMHSCLQNVDMSYVKGLHIDKGNAWKLENAHIMLKYLEVIDKNSEEKKVMKSIIENFSRKLENAKEHLSKGLIHGDLSDMNLIVKCDESHLQPIYNTTTSKVNDFFGIIDFEDMYISYHIFEVAQLIRDFMVSTYPPNCHAVAVTFLSGYLKQRTLNSEEINILFDSIMAALCQYCVIGEYEFLRQPDNEYTRIGSAEASTLIMSYYDSSTDFMSKLTDYLSEKNITIS